jgi:fructokinase
MTTIGFGAILWDDIPEPDNLDKRSCARNIGGSVFNVLVHLHTLGHQSYMISAIGDDELGWKTFETIERLGIERDFIALVPEETCLIRVSFDSTNSPHYSSPDQVSWDNISLQADQLASLNSQTFDYLVFGTLEQRDPRSRSTLRHVLSHGSFRNIFVDLTLREFYSRELLEETMCSATIIKMNDSEAMEVNRLFGFGQTRPDRLIPLLAKTFSADIACITCGERGVWAGDVSTVIHRPAYCTKICDTVGCGDAFSAAFIHKHGKGSPLEECCDYGNRLAALIASKRSSIPDWEPNELEGI